ncbi:hypothetical protein E3N88_06070 [Mikania micrantha]|uniref:Uncharacterized protein n=1 Tax=Mikania micrantha TaxID=192012 RepID=A0A5N6PMQ3_9ASTR|nr:hypothetical protein E3N88_06070 [Mikania micrantha]
MVPSQSKTTHVIPIDIPSPPQTTVSPPPSSPEVVDLLRCNHQKLCYGRFSTKWKKYLGCFKTEDSNSLEKKTRLKNDECIEVRSCSSSGMMQSPNYYSDMSLEERDEKLKSAIVYCKKGTN